MRLGYLLVAVAVVLPVHGASAQGDPDRVIPGGGIKVQGWTGKIDASSVNQGRTINDARFEPEGKGIHITSGPAVTYWNPANTAHGDYTVKATFKEPKYMELNSHPHPYGVFIGGNNMDSAPTLLYCEAYGNGTFIMRGFGPEPFQLGGRRPTPNEAVHKAAEKGAPVEQEIALSLKGGRVECSINGTVVAGYDKADVVGPGKLASTDGVYGIRVSHNVDAIVTGFGKQ